MLPLFFPFPFPQVGLPRRPLATFLGLLVPMLLTLTMMVSPAGAVSVYALPASGASTSVLDEATVLSRTTESQLSNNFATLAIATGIDVHMVTIHRLDYGDTIQSFTDKLFSRWFPSPEQQQNQVLLVLDNVSNQAAIHVGEAAQATLTPDLVESIVEATIAIPIRQGDKYNQALLDAGDRLVAVLSGQEDPGPPQEQPSLSVESTFATAEETAANRDNSTTLVIVLLIAATVIPMVTYFIYVGSGQRE